MKNLLKLAVALGLSAMAYGQTSAVTATITDSDAQTWNNGTFIATFIGAPNTAQPSVWQGSTAFTKQFTGSMNGSGVLSVSVADNAFVSPPGSTWQFQLCSNTSAPCVNVRTTVTGASPSLSAILSAGVIAPRFGAGPFAFGYADAEVITPVVTGASYFNVTSSATRTWNGSTWAASGGGSGTVGANNTATNLVAIYAAAGGSTTVGPDATLSDNGTTLTYSGTIAVLPVGSAAQPDLQATGAAATTGFAITTVAGCWDNAGTLAECLTANGSIAQSTKVIGFSASNAGAAPDTAISRDAAGVVDVGSGASGNTVGKVKASGYISVGTTFTLSANACAATTLTGGGSVGSVASGTTGACTFTVLMGDSATAAHGWACDAKDLTTPADLVNPVTPVSTTSASFSAAATVSGDVIQFKCMGY